MYEVQLQKDLDQLVESYSQNYELRYGAKPPPFTAFEKAFLKEKTKQHGLKFMRGLVHLYLKCEGTGPNDTWYVQKGHTIHLLSSKWAEIYARFLLAEKRRKSVNPSHNIPKLPLSLVNKPVSRWRQAAYSRLLNSGKKGDFEKLKAITRHRVMNERKRGTSCCHCFNTGSITGIDKNGYEISHPCDHNEGKLPEGYVNKFHNGYYADLAP